MHTLLSNSLHSGEIEEPDYASFPLPRTLVNISAEPLSGPFVVAAHYVLTAFAPHTECDFMTVRDELAQVRHSLPELIELTSEGLAGKQRAYDAYFRVKRVGPSADALITGLVAGACNFAEELCNETTLSPLEIGALTESLEIVAELALQWGKQNE